MYYLFNVNLTLCQNISYDMYLALIELSKQTKEKEEKNIHSWDTRDINITKMGFKKQKIHNKMYISWTGQKKKTKNQSVKPTHLQK